MPKVSVWIPRRRRTFPQWKGLALLCALWLILSGPSLAQAPESPDLEPRTTVASNVQEGPGLQHPVRRVLPAGTTLQVAAQTPDGSWLQLTTRRQLDLRRPGAAGTAFLARGRRDCGGLTRVFSGRESGEASGAVGPSRVWWSQAWRERLSPAVGGQKGPVGAEVPEWRAAWCGGPRRPGCGESDGGVR